MWILLQLRGNTITPLILALTMLATLAASGWGQVVYHAGTTRKIRQLTGDYDNPLRRNTLTRTRTSAGVIGTDLGHPFRHNGKLWFAFGDTPGAPGWGDVLGFSTATRASELTNLAFRKNPDGNVEYVDIPGITEDGMETPCGAIDINGDIYLVFSTEWSEALGTVQKSVMARSSNDGDTWSNLYPLSQGVGGNMTQAHFINVSMRKVNAADFPGQLPWSSGEVVLIWGVGLYRKSNVYLACIPVDSIASKSAMRYLSGVDASNNPTWSDSESAAIALFNHPVVGEFSCGWLPQQNRWIMLYAAGEWGAYKRGVQMRTATQPWGVWSEPRVIMNPGYPGDHAYGHYMHVAWTSGHQDAFQDYICAGDNDWGGEYAPYLIEDFTTGDATCTQIYYTMSTWNPYQVLLMKSEIGPGTIGTPGLSGTQTLTVGDESWHKSSSTFYQPVTVGGTPGITTWTNQGDASTGIMWRWLPRDQWNLTLSFSVTSGNGEVILLEGGGDIPTSGNIATIYSNIKAGVYGDVVQCTWGHSSNDIVVPVTWPLRPFDKANLKVVIIDYLTAGWSFIGVSNMSLTRNEPAVPYQVPQIIMPGDGSWTQTSGAWCQAMLHHGVPTLSTLGEAGEGSQGVMWRMLPRDWRNKRLQFTCHGGHGRVLLLEGGDPIPTSGDFSVIASDIQAGKYGAVRETAVGPDSETDLTIDWDLTRHKSHDLKVVVLDSLADSFINLSQMTLTRFSDTPAPVQSACGTDWTLLE